MQPAMGADATFGTGSLMGFAGMTLKTHQRSCDFIVQALTVVKDAALQHSAKLVCIKVRKTQKAASPRRTRARGLS